MRIATTFFHSAITHEAASSFKDRLQTPFSRPREIRPAIIHVSISTAGGHIDCGIELYNFINNKSRTCKIHTHNVGNVDSTGIIVFLGGVKRYAAPTSTFKFHSARYYINNEAFDKRQLREMCDMLENYDSLTRNIIQENTSLDENRITEYMEASRVINSQEALESGIIHEIRQGIWIKENSRSFSTTNRCSFSIKYSLTFVDLNKLTMRGFFFSVP